MAPWRIRRPRTEHACVQCKMWTWSWCGPTRDALLAHGGRVCVLCGADLVVVRANSRRAPPKLVGRGSAARPPHYVGGCGFKPSAILRLTPVVRGPRAHRHVENRPTAHGARARALRSADLVAVRANSRRAPPKLHGHGHGSVARRILKVDLHHHHRFIILTSVYTSQVPSPLPAVNYVGLLPLRRLAYCRHCHSEEK